MFNQWCRRLAGFFTQERRLKNLGLLDDDGETTWDGFFEESMF